VCHCAPPVNKPTREEREHCRPWLQQTVDLLPVHVFLALGQLAWQAILTEIESRNWHTGRRAKFAHGQTQSLSKDRWLLASYHPSQQNTFTGRLTESMFDDVFQTAKELLQRPAGNRG
jgi:uracil-DNA glycosylase family 4